MRGVPSARQLLDLSLAALVILSTDAPGSIMAKVSSWTEMQRATSAASWRGGRPTKAGRVSPAC
jgi:hypothetical protein